MIAEQRRVRASGWLLASMLVIAASVRIPFLDQAPYGFAPNRQHYSALIARAAYFSIAGDRIATWRKTVVDDYMRYTTRPDPAIAERMAALAYRATGGERLWLARGLSSTYWLIGGLALFFAARRLAGDVSGLVTAAVFLFLPWALIASRSLQPDALAVALMGLAIWGATVYDERPTRRRLLATAAVVGAAVLVRAPTACLLCPMMALVLWRRHGLRGVLTSRDAWTFWAIAVAPAAIYYGVVLWTNPRFGQEAGGRLAPSMWLDANFWRGWLERISLSITIPVLAIALAAALFARGAARVVVWSLWFGYVVYSLALPLPASSHTYYQTMLLPVIAMSCGPAAAWLLSRSAQWTRVLAVVCVVGLCLGQAQAVGAFVHRDDRARLDAFRAVGAATGHSLRVVYLTDHFGVTLRYHGEVSGRAWPWRSEIDFYRSQGAKAIPELPAADRLAKLSQELNGAEYFAVTELAEFNAQPDLKRCLESRYPVVASGDRFVVYDLR